MRKVIMEIFKDRPDGATHEAHGVLFIRTGSCKQCGRCEDGFCPHLDEETFKCLIHEQKQEWCDECGGTHQECHDFPKHPWVKVIEEGICGFKFEPLNEEEAKKKAELDKLWQ